MSAKEPDGYYLARAKELVNAMYDKRLLSDDLSRECIDGLEAFLGSIIENLCDSAVLVDRLSRKTRNPPKDKAMSDDLITIETPGSGALASYGYSPSKSLLVVTFNSGATWEYEGVPAELFEQMQSAGSAGKFFHGSVRNKFTGKRRETNETQACPEG